MPSIRHKGVEIYFDSLDEAIAAAEKLAGAGESKPKGAASSATDGRWTISRFRDYVARLSQVQARMLQELVRSEHGRTAKDLASTLSFESAKAFGPVLAAMSKHAKNAGIGFDEVMTSARVAVGREKMLEFKATPAFVKIASEAGWKVGE